MEIDISYDTHQAIEAMTNLPENLMVLVSGVGILAAARAAAKVAKATTSFRDRTGQLRRSIKARPARHKVRLGNKTIRAPGAQVVALAPHSHFFELGTVHMPARPFLRPAVMGTYRKQLQAAAAAMQRRITVLRNRGTIQ